MNLRALTPDFVYQLITLIVSRLVPRPIAEVLATVFGIWTALLPLMIWVAWSADVLFLVLLSGAVSATLYAIFAIATAPDKATTDYQEWKQQRSQFENDRPTPRKPSWRDIP